MKARAAVVSLALLVVVFGWACQKGSPTRPTATPSGALTTGTGAQLEDKSDPGGPCLGERDTKGHCHGDGGGPAPTLGLADGIETTGLPVTVKDSRKKLRVDNGDFMHNVKMAFTDPGTCVGFAATNGSTAPVPGTDGTFEALEGELTELVTSGFLLMQIDMTSLGATSDGHVLIVQYESKNPALGTIRIQLGSGHDQVGPVTVTQPDLNVDVFEFTGPVVVWNATGAVKDTDIIFCPGRAPDPNKVTATVN